MAKKGTIAGIPLGVLVVFIIGIIVVLYILKNKNLFKFGPIVTPAASNHVDGPNIYKVEMALPATGGQNEAGSGGGTEGCSATNVGNSFRDNVSFPCTECARETTWFFVPGSSSGVGFFKPVKFGQQ